MDDSNKHGRRQPSLTSVPAQLKSLRQDVAATNDTTRCAANKWEVSSTVNNAVRNTLATCAHRLDKPTHKEQFSPVMALSDSTRAIMDLVIRDHAHVELFVNVSVVHAAHPA